MNDDKDFILELEKKLKEAQKENGIYSSFDEWYEVNKARVNCIEAYVNNEDLVRIGWEARTEEVHSLKMKYNQLLNHVGGKEIIEGIVSLPIPVKEIDVVISTLFKVVGALIVVFGIYYFI
ncbi:MAG TPA: hypothetical protein VI911_08970 [Patescibacteria group bacterium]|nr:MAG: hypothetical protein UR43_C0005G0038 [candidate division TM6 bacterium GW2011_GWF2_33_332]HLD91129.1 hypothetical protein [Patescibacteria group bacterium]